jgi:hypothetical protein
LHHQNYTSDILPPLGKCGGHYSALDEGIFNPGSPKNLSFPDSLVAIHVVSEQIYQHCLEEIFQIWID